MMNTDFTGFFYPRSLTFLGASNDPGKWGFRVLSNILGGKFEGKIYPVNPKGGEILGLQVYPSVGDLPEVPDLAVIVVPPKAMLEAIRECGQKVIKSCVVITAGFAEVSEEGAAVQRQMVEEAHKAGMRFIGPNCFGLLSTPVKLYSQMPRVYPPRGPIAVVSQSGNVGLTIARRAMALDIGVSRVISTGNEADLHAEDFIEFLADDDETKVILSYIEGFKNGKRFFEAVSKATRKKPVVMIKVGATEAGAAAARSHTAALSGSDEIFDGMCRQAGVIRVNGLDELMNVGYGFLTNPLPKGKRVGIVTLGGGWGVLAADACAKQGLEVVKLSPEIIAEMDTFLPAWWSRNNPVDLVAGAMGESMLRVMEIFARWEKIDGIIALGVPAPSTIWGPMPKTEEEMKERMKFVATAFFESYQKVKNISLQSGKQIVLAAELPLPQGQRAIEFEIIKGIGRLNMVNYALPHEAALVMRNLVRYREYLNGH